MKVKSVIKKLTIYSSMATLLFVLSSSSLHKKNKDIFRNTTKITKHKIEYNNGIIYIGNAAYLNSINNLNGNDVLVLDERNNSDPNLRIYNSHKIVTPEIREEIIESLLLYEEKYPTKWERSKDSLMLEWTAHNLMYFLGINHGSTTDVDLNNADEEVYHIIK